MGKKKRGHPDVEEILSRPWCYYCERDFDDQKVLINHQKAKHFKCERCGRRLNTAGGLSVHMSQVHKETLSAVDNALPNRAGLDLEIFGMMGVPEEIIHQHNQRVLTQFHQAEAERRAANGNTGGPGGASAGGQSKKPKFESPSDLKKRLAEHKAKLAAEQANGGASGSGTPIDVAKSQSPAAEQATNLQYPQQQQQQQQHRFNSAQLNTPANFAPAYAQASLPGQPFQVPGVPFPPPSPFSPPPMQNQAPFLNMHFPPHLMQPNVGGGPTFQGVAQSGTVGLPPPFGLGSPVQHFGFQQQQPVRIQTPPQNGLPPQRPLSGNLPSIPGLPQRPSFGVPQVNHFQMQQMHQGQVSSTQPTPVSPIGLGPQVHQDHAIQQTIVASQDATQPHNDESSLDDLISGASKQAEDIVTHANSENELLLSKHSELLNEISVVEPVGAKSGKKEKAKPSHLVYLDQSMSPEERMSRMPRYAYSHEDLKAR